MADNIVGTLYHKLSTKSSASEDGQNNCPKRVELTGIINKPLLLHLVGCLYYLYQWWTVKQISENEIYLLIKYIKSVLWRGTKCLSYIEEARCLKVKQRILNIPELLTLPRTWTIWRSYLRDERNFANPSHKALPPDPIRSHLNTINTLLPS